MHRICCKLKISGFGLGLSAGIRIKMKMKVGGKECFRGPRMVKQRLEQAVSYHGD
jgi:hypothetical protein